MTYLFLMKMLDDAQIKKEANAEILKASVDNPVFKEGEQWHNPDTDKDVPYNTLRWHVFKNYKAAQMFNTIRTDVFPFRSRVADDYARLESAAIPLCVGITRNLPVCTRGLFRSQQPPEALSCMQNRFSTHTTPSFNALLCALEAVSAHGSVRIDVTD